MFYIKKLLVCCKTSIAKVSVKEKWVFSCYGIAFDGKGMRSCGSNYTKNVIDSSSSSHADNCKNNILALGEGDLLGINGSFGATEKKFSIDFSKAKTKCCLSLHYNGDNSYLFVNGKELFKFIANNGNVNFPTHFCLGSIFNGFSAAESREVCLK